MIAYLCPDNPNPSGGVKTQYRHVEILVSEGYDACLLHEQPGFRPTWFASTAPIRSLPQTPLGPTDLLVVPEIYGPQIAAISERVPVLIFNQNVHYTFRGYPIPPAATTPWPYRAPGVRGVMVLTDYEREQIETLLEVTIPVWTVRHGIDPAMFHPPGPDDPPKRRQIAYMPRKHADEAQAVFGMLWAMGALDGWTVVPIDGQSERASARILRESAVFFAFGYPEGGTLPPFEALASGCEVVGYGGFASDDDLRDCGGILVPSGNTMHFAAAAKTLLRRIDSGSISPGVVSARFSLADERKALLTVMQHVVG